jgi:hypothetical protein
MFENSNYFKNKVHLASSNPKRLPEILKAGQGNFAHQISCLGIIPESIF